YASDSNRLLSTGLGAAPLQRYATAPTLATPCSYNAHGSMTQLPHLSAMAWDYTEHLHYMSRAPASQGSDADACPDSSLEAWYRYDATQQRIRKRVVKQGGLVEERFYLGGLEWYRRMRNGVVIEEIETLHLFDGPQRLLMVDQILLTDRAGLGQRHLYRYCLGNYVGSTTVEVDDKADVISYEEYHPYGTTAYQAGPNGAEVKLKRYRYTGMERDEESGLSYHGARYYAASLGRWVACDRAGIADGLGLYSYCRGNPVGFLDVSGNSTAPGGLKDTIGGYYVGFFDYLVGPSDLSNKSEDFKASYNAIYTYPKRQLAKDVSANPVAAGIAGSTLGLMSGFVPGAPDGSDLPESMQEWYQMFSFASKNATAIVEGFQGFKSLPPAARPPQLASAGASVNALVATPRIQALAAMDNVIMAASASSGSEPPPPKPSTGYEAGNLHPATGKEVLGRLQQTDRASATVEPGTPKLDELVMAAKPSAKLPPPPVVTLENTGKHDPSSLSYSTKKSVMPPVQKQIDLFNKSVPASSNGQTVPARGALDEAGNVHQFHSSGPNNYHWAGQQGGVNKFGKPVNMSRATISYFERMWRVFGK
ncbi:MAG: RHS repeat-associated core domain-containing protein, partial [Telluria sp.]